MISETHHKQVPFKLFNGNMTTVDEGMYEILSELRRLGVRTQYSCQGETLGAYVLADWKSFRPVIKMLRKSKSSKIAQRMLSDHRRYEIAWFFGKGNFEAIKKVVRRGSRNLFDGYSYEVMWSNYYGLRTVLRWPENETENVLKILKEL